MNFTQKLQDAGYTGHVITHEMIKQLFPGTDSRIYSVINRAIKRKELTSLRRGLYWLTDQVNGLVPSQMFLANNIVKPSYVTMQSALAFHDWIPERVETAYSVSAFRRQKIFENELGRFVYFTSASDPFVFYNGVERIDYDGKTVSVATPLRALIDLCYFRKIDGMNRRYLEESLRIEPENISSITLNDINELREVYPRPRVKDFFKDLLGV